MMSKQWLDAAIVLGKDPDAKVQCPVCEAAATLCTGLYSVAV